MKIKNTENLWKGVPISRDGKGPSYVTDVPVSTLTARSQSATCII